MSSNPNSLPLVTFCSYLTELQPPWRNVDHTASKMVKALKGDPIKGYFELNIGGHSRRYEQSNIGEFLKIVPKVLANAINSKIEGSATLVPIPNSHVTAIDSENFRTLDLARAVAAESKGRLTAAPALVFKSALTSSRKGGSRNKYTLESAYRITQKVEGPVVLIDDVCTTGNHLIAAAWRVREAGADPVLACALGRSRKEQVENPLTMSEEELSLDRLVRLF